MPKQTDYDPEWDPAYLKAQELILDAVRTEEMALHLGWGHLTTLPREIGRLAELRELDLSGNQLSALPPEIGRLTSLTVLDLEGNQLSALPPEIGHLTSLMELSLRGNQLSALPPEIGRLTSLTVLDLESNQLSALPPEIGRLTSLTELYLHGNPALGLPPDVLGATWQEVENGQAKPAAPRAIFDYYFSRQLGGDRPLNEVKLVFVGRGGAGKTSLVGRLVFDCFDPALKETPGVTICDWRMRDCPGGEVLAHVWDFAGQTITHSMHQFFLSVRTVYVLVLTGRENSEREDAEYWLRLIAAYGSDRSYITTESGEIITTEVGEPLEVESPIGPPVIVALNKWDDQGSARARVDRRALRERYPFIVDYVETDCATKTGIAKLRELLHSTVDALPWVRAPFPEIYRKVKTELEAVRDPHLPYDEYRRICRACGVADEERQDLLAENLHALGVALNYRRDERLRFASVLKPHWLTEHVYALVRHAEEKAGVLHRAALPSVLADEPDARMRQFLVEMMVRFELAYPLAEENEAPAKWLVPQALPDSQPEGVETFGREADATRLRYTYRALPVSIVPRFIVRTHPFIEGELRWASGVVLRLGGARALVRADYVEKQVEITATGPAEARRELAGLAQQEFRFMNGQIKGLNPVEEMMAEGEWVPVKTLERDEAATRQTGVATDAGTVNVDPTAKLNEFSEKAARDDSWKPRIFISYSHADEAQRKKLELHLKVLVTHGALHERWDDRKIQPGEDWDRTIKREVEEADVVLLLVSTAALASHYIETVEMKRALERAAAGEALVIPIILEDCQWKLPELKILQALPAGAKPVRDWTPHAKGWKSVSDGLLAVFERLRKERAQR